MKKPHKNSKYKSVGPTEEELLHGFQLIALRRPKIATERGSDRWGRFVDDVIGNVPRHAAVGAFAWAHIHLVGDMFTAEQWRARKGDSQMVTYWPVKWNAERQRFEPEDMKQMFRVRRARRVFYKSLRHSYYFFEAARAVIVSKPDKRIPGEKSDYIATLAMWLETAWQLWAGAYGDPRTLLAELNEFKQRRLEWYGNLYDLTKDADEPTKQTIFRQFAATRDDKWMRHDHLVNFFNPSKAGTRGGAKSKSVDGAHALSRGLLVRTLDTFIPEFDGPRYATIAGCLELAGIDGLSAAKVRSILLKGKT